MGGDPALGGEAALGAEELLELLELLAVLEKAPSASRQESCQGSTSPCNQASSDASGMRAAGGRRRAPLGAHGSGRGARRRRSRPRRVRDELQGTATRVAVADAALPSRVASCRVARKPGARVGPPVHRAEEQPQHFKRPDASARARLTDFSDLPPFTPSLRYTGCVQGHIRVVKILEGKWEQVVGAQECTGVDRNAQGLAAPHAGESHALSPWPRTPATAALP